MSERRALKKAKRIVVKIGSKALASDSRALETLVAEIAEAQHAGRRIALVSSGAIALGVKKLGWKSRPKEIARLQAAAAAGQSLLMRAYEDAFSSHKIVAAQVLLTHADIAERTRANNARAALSELLEHGAVPVLNENDSVSVEEIKFGDNDQLSAMVVPLVDADVLILLSDIPGLLDAKGVRVPMVHDIERDAIPLIQSSRSDVGTGGMQSKIEAARRATLAGCTVVIADARVPGTLTAILKGDDCGTLFVPAKTRIPARKHWIAFTLRPKGDFILDAGCVTAIQKRSASVLAVGVLGVRGSFAQGDAVRLCDSHGKEVGRGLTQLSVTDAARTAGHDKTLVVHHDELVVW
jgi:glutamate 5-kinase